jgi:hypothetical protein
MAELPPSMLRQLLAKKARNSLVFKAVVRSSVVDPNPNPK